MSDETRTAREVAHRYADALGACGGDHTRTCDYIAAAVADATAEHAARLATTEAEARRYRKALEAIVPLSLRDGRPFICGECGAGIGAFPHREECTLGMTIEIVVAALAAPQSSPGPLVSTHTDWHVSKACRRGIHDLCETRRCACSCGQHDAAAPGPLVKETP